MKCPICGEDNTLGLSCLYQYSKDYKITKNGCLSKKYTKDCGNPMEVEILTCKNGCEVNDLDWSLDYKTRKLTIEQTNKRWSWK